MGYTLGLNSTNSQDEVNPHKLCEQKNQYRSPRAKVPKSLHAKKSPSQKKTNWNPKSKLTKFDQNGKPPNPSTGALCRPSVPLWGDWPEPKDQKPTCTVRGTQLARGPFGFCGFDLFCPQVGWFSMIFLCAVWVFELFCFFYVLLCCCHFLFFLPWFFAAFAFSLFLHFKVNMTLRNFLECMCLTLRLVRRVFFVCFALVLVVRGSVAVVVDLKDLCDILIVLYALDPCLGIVSCTSSGLTWGASSGPCSQVSVGCAKLKQIYDVWKCKNK